MVSFYAVKIISSCIVHTHTRTHVDPEGSTPPTIRRGGKARRVLAPTATMQAGAVESSDMVLGPVCCLWAARRGSKGALPKLRSMQACMHMWW